MLKRFEDISLSLIGVIILLPFFPIIALLIKLDSKGPVFYLGDRVGKDKKIFKMYKFRTMIETPIKVGGSVSPQYDPRVTAFGRFLRRTKLNELPQLINILKGEMTFVGPRPETPDLAELYPEKLKEFFSVKPGLVGPNQILGRNEEEMYPTGVDVKKYYLENILPPKIEVDMEYIKNPSFLKDIQYIFLGVKETLFGMLKKKFIQDNRSQIYLFLSDITLSLFSYSIAYILIIEGFPEGYNTTLFFKYLTAIILIRPLCFFYFGLYNTLIRYISYHDILQVVKSVTCGSLILNMFVFIFGYHDYSRVIFIMDWTFLIILLSGLRFSLRYYGEKWHEGDRTEKNHRVLIFGANEAGSIAYSSIVAEKDESFEIVGFIDDTPEKYGKTLHGLKVLGNCHDIKALALLYKVEVIILAVSSTPMDELNKIIEICQEANIRYRVFPFVRNPDTNTEIQNRHRNRYPLKVTKA